MKRIQLLVGIVLAIGLTVVVVRGAMPNAQDPLKSGKILQRIELTSAPGMEAILVLRELPPGGESGRHTQSGQEIVYIQEGSVTLEVQGKPPVTLKAGEAFRTTAGEVHNVKNANADAPGRALAFYIAKKGTTLENLSVPVK